MLKKTFVLGLFVVLFLTNCKKNESTNSTTLATVNIDTNRVKKYHDSAFLYVYSSPDSSMRYANQELRNAAILNYKKGTVRGLLDIANVEWITGRYPSALELQIGALSECDNIRDWGLKARCYNNMGIVYNEMNLEIKAINYSRMSMKINEARRDTSFLITDYINLGEYYTKDQLDSALFFLNGAETVASQPNFKQRLGRVFLDFGTLFTKKKDTLKALSFLNKSIPLLSAQRDYHSLNQAYLEVAGILTKQKQLKQAISYANLAISSASRSNYTLGLLKADQFLFDNYKNTELKDSTLKYLLAEKNSSEKLFSPSAEFQVSTLDQEERLRVEKIKEDERRRKKLFQDNLQFAALAAIIPMFILVLIRTKRRVTSNAIESWGLVGLLAFFEFLTLLIHHFLGMFTDEKPIYMLPILTGVAYLLLPFHHKMQKWLKSLLSQKHSNVQL